MPIAAVSDIESWAKKDLDASVEAELVLSIAHAQKWIASQAGLRSLEKEAAAVTSYFDAGVDSNGQDLWLPMSHRPLWHKTPDLITVSENGAALTLALGYSATADVSIRNANTTNRVRLSRVGGWYWGVGGANNIEVASICGFDPSLTASTNPVTVDVKRLVMEVGWLMFNSAGRIGIDNTSKAGASATIVNDLSPVGRATIDWLRGV